MNIFHQFQDYEADKVHGQSTVYLFPELDPCSIDLVYVCQTLENIHICKFIHASTPISHRFFLCF